MLKKFCIISLLTMTGILTGCSDDPPKTEVRTNSISITNANECQLLNLDRGQELSITLPSNPSTGYGWSISLMPTILQQMPETAQYNAEKTSQPMLGSENQTTWRFLATTVGQDKLQLIYRRPWEKNVKPSKTFTCNITVK